jgi:hypothetical protein
MLIVTSSPIEGKQCENSSPLPFSYSSSGDNPTWSELLCKFQTVRDRKNGKKQHISVVESTTDTETSCSNLSNCRT